MFRYKNSFTTYERSVLNEEWLIYARTALFREIIFLLKKGLFKMRRNVFANQWRVRIKKVCFVKGDACLVNQAHNSTERCSRTNEKGPL